MRPGLCILPRLSAQYRPAVRDEAGEHNRPLKQNIQAVIDEQPKSGALTRRTAKTKLFEIFKVRSVRRNR
jgi:hypothetical protein